MYILTNHDDVISFISKTIGEQENGNILINHDTLAIPKQFIKQTYEVTEIPEGVIEEKYCYTEEKGFYPNENYIEPINEEDRFTDIELALAEIYELIEGGK